MSVSPLRTAIASVALLLLLCGAVAARGSIDLRTESSEWTSSTSLHRKTVLLRAGVITSDEATRSIKPIWSEPLSQIAAAAAVDSATSAVKRATVAVGSADFAVESAVESAVAAALVVDEATERSDATITRTIAAIRRAAGATAVQRAAEATLWSDEGGLQAGRIATTGRRERCECECECGRQ